MRKGEGEGVAARNHQASRPDDGALQKGYKSLRTCIATGTSIRGLPILSLRQLRSAKSSIYKILGIIILLLYQGDKSAKDARFNVLVHYIGDEPDMPVKRHLIWSSPMMGSETHEKIYAKLVDLQTRFNAPMRMWCADGASVNGVSHLRFGPENLVAKWREMQGPLLRWWCSNHRLDISLSRPWSAKGIPILHEMLSAMYTFFSSVAKSLMKAPAQKGTLSFFTDQIEDENFHANLSMNKMRWCGRVKPYTNLCDMYVAMIVFAQERSQANTGITGWK